jgi:hypothetical protein
MPLCVVSTPYPHWRIPNLMRRPSRDLGSRDTGENLILHGTNNIICVLFGRSYQSSILGWRSKFRIMGAFSEFWTYKIISNSLDGS